MRRLIIIYNPQSANFERVEKEVLESVRQLRGWTIGKYVVKPEPVSENSRRIARILRDGDLVIVAGGDGTASVGVNGIITSGKKVTLGVLGYGNFNDLAHTLGAKNLDELLQAYKDRKIETMWPLAISINERLWRYSACYLTVGLLADSTKVFDKPATRKKLKKRRRGLVFSIWTLANWYFKTRKHRVFLPKVYLNGRERSYEMTDYLAINSKRVANVMRGSDCYLKKDVFWRSMVNMKSVGALITVMAQSILRRVPGKEVMADVLTFQKPVNVGVQVEGEYHRLKEVEKITIDKAKHGLKVVKVR